MIILFALYLFLVEKESAKKRGWCANVGGVPSWVCGSSFFWRGSKFLKRGQIFFGVGQFFFFFLAWVNIFIKISLKFFFKALVLHLSSSRKNSLLEGTTMRLLDICDALRNLVPFVQFKKREKHPWRIELNG